MWVGGRGKAMWAGQGMQDVTWIRWDLHDGTGTGTGI